MRRRPTSYGVTVALLALALATIVFGNSFGTMVTDIKPEVYFAPSEMFSRYLAAWSSTPYLGHPNFNVGLAPVFGVLSPLEWMGMPPEWIFKVSHFFLWWLAGWGAARLLRELAPRVGPWGGLAAGVLYVANPYAVVGGSTLAILLPHAFLPWLLLCGVRSVRFPQSWRWSAGVGLAFFAMSGMNAAVVPLLLLLAFPIFTAVAGRAYGRSWTSIVIALGRNALFVLLVSLYWLVPSFSATQAGLGVVNESETIDGIARVSSSVEVLRGMGMWTLYGFDGDGPWIPEFEHYIANPFVVLITLAWPVLGVLGLAFASRLVRLASALTLAVTLVVMVGFFPGRIQTPLAWMVQQLFELVPFLSAFRTTNKAGSLLALAFALVIADAGSRMVERRGWSVQGGRRLLPAIAAGCALITIWVHPALSGNLYTSPVDVPNYWQEAAEAIDARDPSGRVLFLPTQVRASYRWTQERPDDVSNSLFQREAIVTHTSPSPAPPAANFMAAVGDLTTLASPGDSVTSAMARYLGATDVLLRHDLRWETWNGARPEQSAQLLGDDSGLRGISNFGEPGEFVAGPFEPTPFESILPPVQLYEVSDSSGTVSARDATTGTVVAGDAWSFDAMNRMGLLAGTPPVWYAMNLSAGELEALFGPPNQLMITDTNQLRSAVPNRVIAGYGPLLPPGADAEVTRVLGTSEDQTVLRRSGPSAVASQTGGAFFDTPYGQPDNALDGDLSTSWLFGDFQRAPGVTLDVEYESPQVFDVVPILTDALGDVRITDVTMTAGTTSRSVSVSQDGFGEVDFGGVRAQHFTLRVDAIEGEGFSLVGVKEIGLPGDKVERAARLPLTMNRLFSELDEEARTAFAATPLDIAMSRVANSSAPNDDSEAHLLRDFSLPDDRVFQVESSLRLSPRDESAWDRVVGSNGEVQATSSSHLFDDPAVRASRALDGNEATGWIPGDSAFGSWWQITGPQRDIPRVVLTQDDARPDQPRATASYVDVVVDGRRVAGARVSGGVNTIQLPEGTRGETVRIVITGVERPNDGDSFPPRFTSIEAGALPSLPDRQPLPGEPGECLDVATLDGHPLRMRPADLAALLARPADAHAWEGCEPLALSAGEHRLRPRDPVVMDSLDLRDTRQTRTPRPVGTSVSGVSGTVLTSQLAVVHAQSERTVLRIGQSFDPRWRATIDGRDAGPPVIVDGWSVGWVIEGAGRHEVRFWFGPQRASTAAMVVSAGTLLASLFLLVVRRPRLKPTPFRRTNGGCRPRNRAVIAGVVAALATVGFGIPGLVGVGLAMLLAHTASSGAGRYLRSWSWRSGVGLGAAGVALGGLLQIVLSRESWGTLDPTVPSASLWPHWITVVGVVLATVSVCCPDLIDRQWHKEEPVHDGI